MLKKTGIPTQADLQEVYPRPERLAQGPVAVIECFQRIPCNPCATACQRGAIQPFEDINDRPQLDVDRCNGCALCVASCPGLAIFVVDETYSEDQALIKLPYEFLPLPQEGKIVAALNRAGEKVGEGIVVRVQNPPAFDRTAVIHLAVPRELASDVRNILVEGEPHAER
ncbi:MAG: 4Fe-4S dicluster domain-containing protein [Firmicutes bacterium]|nr:4Fe-4S dicluster domain-containing protein [Bacillota bacterium]